MPVWQVANQKPLQTLEDVRQQLLGARNVTAEDETEFFTPTYAGSVGNPFDFVGMEEAVERILFAIESDERILVWGDYDADGVSATATMLEVLRQLSAQAAPYLPHRGEEGYGLHRETLQRLQDSFDLLITVDCGGSNVEEIEWLIGLGKDVIVVDHHELPEQLPSARAILHPRHPKGEYRTTHLSGAGVAWKLAQALLRKKEAPEAAEKWLLDLPLIGTLADSMPLVRENRAIVHFGLQVLARARRPGLRAMMDAARLSPNNIRAEDVIFRVIPPINAAGRIDHPQAALDVLLAQSAGAAAKATAKLMQCNQERRQATERVLKEAEAAYDPSLPLVFAYSDTWPAGIVGIVAGRLAQQFQKPAIVIGGARETAVGSARTFGEIDVHAALQQAAQYTAKLGGHKQAAGFSLAPNNVLSFRDALVEVLAATQRSSTDERILAVDGILDEHLLHWDLQRTMQAFEPFGEGNQEPVFVIKGIALSAMRAVGKQKQHLKARLTGATREIDAIGFDIPFPDMREGSLVDVAGSIQVNHFNGNTALQFRLLDIASPNSVTLKT